MTIFFAQVSYGEMIGCDNQDCPIEWFHFGCMVNIIPATVLPLIPLSWKGLQMVKIWQWCMMFQFRLYGVPSSAFTDPVVYILYTDPVPSARWFCSGFFRGKVHAVPYGGLVPTVQWLTSSCLIVQFRLYGGLCGCLIKTLWTFMTGLHCKK